MMENKALTQTEEFLVKLGFFLLILAVLGPLTGRAGLLQTILLALAPAAGLYALDRFLLVPRLQDHRLAAIADAVAAAAILRATALILGAGYGWGGAALLGAAMGAAEYFLHRWGTVAR